MHKNQLPHNRSWITVDSVMVQRMNEANRSVKPKITLRMPKAESDSFSLVIFLSINARLQKHVFIISVLLF